jgi:DNA-binding response OmpR family regulator
MAEILVIGLECDAEKQLSQVLREQHHRVLAGGYDEVPLADPQAALVFCDGDRHPGLLRRIRLARPDLPVVVVTCLPETTKWLDALENGAADYCSAPFERTQVGWIIAAALSPAAQAS